MELTALGNGAGSVPTNGETDSLRTNGVSSRTQPTRPEASVSNHTIPAALEEPVQGVDAELAAAAA